MAVRVFYRRDPAGGFILPVLHLEVDEELFLILHTEPEMWCDFSTPVFPMQSNSCASDIIFFVLSWSHLRP